MSDATVLPEVLPACHPGLEVVEFDNAMVIFDVRNRMSHELIGTPAAVFDGCRDSLTSRALIDELITAGVGDEEHVSELLSEALDDLARLGLLAGHDAPAPPPCIGCMEVQRQRRHWWTRR